MKKVIISLFIFILLTGCSKEKVNICKIDLENNESNYKLSAEYKIYNNNSFVTKIEKYEEYNSSDTDMINYFKESKDIEYGALNEKYGGYEYLVTSSRNSVKVRTIIDINNVDIKSMVKDNYLSDYYVNNNKLTLGGIKYFYEAKGAKCDI